MSEKRTDKDLANQWKTIDWEKTESIVNRLQTRIAKATQEGKPLVRCRPKRGSGMREPYALKGARTVPGRGEGGNTLSLFDETLTTHHGPRWRGPQGRSAAATGRPRVCRPGRVAYAGQKRPVAPIRSLGPN